jgi:hypothetical protein
MIRMILTLFWGNVSGSFFGVASIKPPISKLGLQGNRGKANLSADFLLDQD